jgi:hypothetical protein
MKRNFSLWLAALLAVLFFSCNKELAEDLVATESEQIAEARAALKTPEEVNFFDFNYLSVTNPHLHQELSFRDGEEDSLILALADRILLQNATHGFVPELVNKIGYPIWDRSKIIYAQDNYNRGVIIPFAKSDDSFIRAFLFAVPFSQDWIFLLKDKSTLLSAMQSSLSQAQADTLAWTAISYLNIDQQLFETRDISIESWLRAYAGGSSGFSNQEDNLNSRCNVVVYTTGTCIYTVAFSPDTPEEEVNFRGPCPQNYMWVESLAIIRHCGGSGGNWWGGVSNGGSNCLGCPGSPWNDPAIAQQVQRCELISDIANSQIPGSLSQFSQAEIDLCNNLSTLMEQLVLSADNVKFLIGNLDQLAILTAYFSSGIATLADQNAAIAFMNLSQEGKISMTLREFMALHRLVFGELGPKLGLTELEMNWLLEQGTLARDKIKNFLDISQNNSDPNAIGFASFAISLMMEDSEIRWDRLEELYNLVNNDPNSLIETCLNSNSLFPLSFWSELASFTPPAVVIDKINSLSGDWEIQDIEDASGNRVNLDYFPIKITTLPEKSPGVRYTADEFLAYIRKHINDFAIKEGTHFDAIPGDENLWLSDNPLTAVISITINPDDGSVITSQHEPCCWIFTTLKADSDWFETDDGWHPVSGNRQFGYSQNPDGSYIFYTKGADRVTTWYHNLGEDMAFNGADDLWTNFQANVKAFVNEEGGLSSLSSAAVALRPNWAEIRNRLKISTPITFVPCN